MAWHWPRQEYLHRVHRPMLQLRNFFQCQFTSTPICFPSESLTGASQKPNIIVQDHSSSYTLVSDSDPEAHPQGLLPWATSNTNCLGLGFPRISSWDRDSFVWSVIPGTTDGGVRNGNGKKDNQLCYQACSHSGRVEFSPAGSIDKPRKTFLIGNPPAVRNLAYSKPILWLRAALGNFQLALCKGRLCFLGQK